MTSWTIRPIEEGDQPAIVLLARGLDKWFNQEGLAQIARDVNRHGGFVAARGDRITGFVTWTPADEDVAVLSWIAVAEFLHRSGIGRALVQALAAELRRAGFRNLEVSTVADSVDYEPYARTRHFYRAMGFDDYRVDKGYYGGEDDPYDRLVMRMDLVGEGRVPSP